MWTATREFFYVGAMPQRASASGTPVSGPRVVAQVRYRDTPAARATAAALVARKCRNSAALLNKFRPYQRRYLERAATLEQSIRRLMTIEERAARGLFPGRSVLFLLEAHAARAYWAGVRTLVALHDPAWERRYPRAQDPLNLLLNVGYTFLVRWVREAIRAVGLLPEIGFFHAVADGKEPLVYDLMELFRQPVVDAVVLPMLTKKKRPVSRLSERDMRRAVTHFHEQWERPFWYRSQCVSLRQIAERETVSLAHAMVSGRPWAPYRHPWGHGWTCVGYRRSPDRKKRLRNEAAHAQ